MSGAIQPCKALPVATAGRAAYQASCAQLEALGWTSSFVDQLYDHLQERIRDPLNLERAAQAFEMSPASLKRRLHKQGTGFQEQLDQVRKHVALYLYRMKGYSNEDVANYLRFNDTTNFRRAVKRWTGLAPSGLRRLFD